MTKEELVFRIAFKVNIVVMMMMIIIIIMTDFIIDSSL
jgi:hypothetical protein